jgi:hypothetical protein
MIVANKKKPLYGKQLDDERSPFGRFLGTNVSSLFGLDPVYKPSLAETFVESKQSDDIAGNLSAGLQSAETLLRPEETQSQRLAKALSNTIAINFGSSVIGNAIPSASKFMSGVAGTYSPSEAERHAAQNVNNVKLPEDNAYSTFGVNPTLFGTAAHGNMLNKNVDPNVIRDEISREASHFRQSNEFKGEITTPDGVVISASPEHSENLRRLYDSRMDTISNEYKAFEESATNKRYVDQDQVVSLYQGVKKAQNSLDEGYKFGFPEDHHKITAMKQEVAKALGKERSGESIIRSIRELHLQERDALAKNKQGLANVFAKAAKDVREAYAQVDPQTAQQLLEIDDQYRTIKEFQETNKEASTNLIAIKNLTSPVIFNKMDQMLTAAGMPEGTTQQIVTMLKKSELNSILQSIEGSPASLPQALTRLRNLQKVASTDKLISSTIPHFSRFEKIRPIDYSSGNMGALARTANAQYLSEITGGGALPYLHTMSHHGYPSTMSRGLNLLLERGASLDDVRDLARQIDKGIIGNILHGAFKDYSPFSKKAIGALVKHFKG